MTVILFTPTLVNTLTIGAHRLTHPEHDITEEPFGQNWGDKLGARRNNPGYNSGFPSVTFSNDNYYQLGQLQTLGRIPHGLRAR